MEEDNLNINEDVLADDDLDAVIGGDIEPDICSCGECEECIAKDGECTCGDCDVCVANKEDEDDLGAEDLYDDIEPEDDLF